MENEGLFLLEAHPVPKIWGGDRLSKLKGIQGQEIGETWEISGHPDGPSLYEKGPLNKLFKDLPYLVKLIDTNDHLSVQVHPNDEYALIHENQKGKTECWIILEAEAGAGIYLGLKEGFTKKDLQKSLENKEDISKLLNFYPVEKGDFFVVPAGSIHAIGKGVFLAEVQQSSGVTYRVWDWNRVDSKGNSRELHIDKALDVINFEASKNTPSFFSMRKDIFSREQELFSHKDFKLKINSWKKGEIKTFDFDLKRPLGIFCLNGELEISTKIQKQKQGPYRSLLINSGPFAIEAKEDSLFLTIA